MSLYKIKNPVEYSFHIWINNYPDSGHWADKGRFLSFVKTVCRYNAKKWKNANYLKKKVLERLPNFDLGYLEHLLRLYDELIEFYKATPLTSNYKISDRTVKDDHYIEMGVKKGTIYKRELPN